MTSPLADGGRARTPGSHWLFPALGWGAGWSEAFAQACRLWDHLCRHRRQLHVRLQRNVARALVLDLDPDGRWAGRAPPALLSVWNCWACVAGAMRETWSWWQTPKWPSWGHSVSQLEETRMLRPEGSAAWLGWGVDGTRDNSASSGSPQLWAVCRAPRALPPCPQTLLHLAVLLRTTWLKFSIFC